MRHAFTILVAVAGFWLMPAIAFADVIPLPLVPEGAGAAKEAKPAARSLVDFDLYTTTLTDFESGMLGVGASWTGSTAFPVVKKQSFVNDVSVFVRAGWRQSETIFAQLSAPLWLEVREDGEVDVAGTVELRGHVGTKVTSGGTFGIDLEEQVSLWRRTVRKFRGDVLLPRAEYGAHQSQGVRSETTLWLRRNIDTVATFALPLSYAYEAGDVSASGLAGLREAHEISLGGGIRDYSTHVHHGWMEFVGLSWSSIRISDVTGSEPTREPETKLRPSGAVRDVQLQRIDLRVANFDDYVWVVDDEPGVDVVMGNGAWVGGSC